MQIPGTETLNIIQGMILIVLSWSCMEIIKLKIAHTKDVDCLKRIEGILLYLRNRFDESHETAEKAKI